MAWLRSHLHYCVEPLLAEPCILDVDTTIKPLYGHPEGAVLGYIPKKLGRPSGRYLIYSMAQMRLVLDVDVCTGDQHTSKHAAPSLWVLLDRLPYDCWPTLLRGDSRFGNEGVMREPRHRIATRTRHARQTTMRVMSAQPTRTRPPRRWLRPPPSCGASSKMRSS